MWIKVGKRVFDLLFCLCISPFFLVLLCVLSILIISTSKGGAFFAHKRLGKGGKEINVYKFRSMVSGAENKGLSITAGNDVRITPIGAFMRKTKLDELPQILNILKGEMSLIGPRPEVAKYIDLEDLRWQKILRVKPGLSDLSSLIFRGEEQLLALVDDPEKAYSEVILPMKLELAIEGIEKSSFIYDLNLCIKTVLSILNVKLARQEDVLQAAQTKLNIF